MTIATDETHRPDRRSWVESANEPANDFPIQNLPFGTAFRGGSTTPVVAIGDRVVDLAAAVRARLIGSRSASLIARCASTGALNPLLAAGRPAMTTLRAELSELLGDDTEAGREARRHAGDILVATADVEMRLPSEVGDYSDFYASIHHATNVGRMFRPDNPLLPNYKWVPIGYHGRASSLVASGTPVRRPHGQTLTEGASEPSFGPSKRLDYELEVGVVIGAGNEQGEAIALARAEEHVAGLCLVNDWSARDIQTWEYQPLGPFLAKSFATTVSPWLVTMDALAPFRRPAYVRPAGDPGPLPYLAAAGNQAGGGVDITLEVLLVSVGMREQGMAPWRVSIGDFGSMYWTVAQLVTHHASNGCNLRPGDLMASGTVSGPSPESRGCLLERSWRGTEPLVLPTGEERRFLADGDEVVIRGWCERDGYRRIGFGECRGTISAA